MLPAALIDFAQRDAAWEGPRLQAPKVQGSLAKNGFGASGLGFRVWGLGFRV